MTASENQAQAIVFDVLILPLLFAVLEVLEKMEEFRLQALEFCTTLQKVQGLKTTGCNQPGGRVVRNPILRPLDQS